MFVGWFDDNSAKKELIPEDLMSFLPNFEVLDIDMGNVGILNLCGGGLKCQNVVDTVQWLIKRIMLSSRSLFANIRIYY